MGKEIGIGKSFNDLQKFGSGLWLPIMSEFQY